MPKQLLCENSAMSRDFDGTLISVPCGGEAKGIIFFPDYAHDDGVTDEVVTGSMLVCDSCGPEVYNDIKHDGVEWIATAQLFGLNIEEVK